MKHSLLCLALATASASPVWAKQAMDLPLSESVATAHHCDADCVSAYEKNIQSDFAAVGKDFDFDFYATAANFTGSKPGDLLKLEPIDASTLKISTGTTVYRIQYASVDLDGSTVPATGFIALPYAKPIDGSGVFRLAAWAHGATGFEYGCAPSNGPSLLPGAWQSLVNSGYAVVAPDYAGIGNNYTTHKQLTFSVHAADVYWSTVAARKAFGSMLSKKWVSIGHSQGGGAVWKLAESKYAKKDRNYLGTVALSPGTYLVDSILNDYYNFPTPALALLLSDGLHRADPSYNTTILTDLMQSRFGLQQILQTCGGGLLSLIANLTNEQIVSKENLKRDLPKLREWQKREAPSAGDSSFAPIFLAQGENDQDVTPKYTIQSWERSCQNGNEVHLYTYPLVGHVAIVDATQTDWLWWINQRFEKGHRGEKKQKCSRVQREPLDPKAVVISPG